MISLQLPQDTMDENEFWQWAKDKHVYMTGSRKAAHCSARETGGAPFTEHSNDTGRGCWYSRGAGGLVNALAHGVVVQEPLPSKYEGPEYDHLYPVWIEEEPHEEMT